MIHNLPYSINQKHFIFHTGRAMPYYYWVIAAARAVQLPMQRKGRRQPNFHEREVAHEAGGDAISACDLMDDDGLSSALEAFKALHHPDRKAAEKLLITDGLRKAEQREMRHYIYMGT